MQIDLRLTSERLKNREKMLNVSHWRAPYSKNWSMSYQNYA